MFKVAWGFWLRTRCRLSELLGSLWPMHVLRPQMKVCLLTGANPGHSYTVKSPSSFSSSVDAPESGILGSSLLLQRSNTQRHTVIGYWTVVSGWTRQRDTTGLTSPGRASAASGAGNGTSAHSGPASCLQAKKASKVPIKMQQKPYSWHFLTAEAFLLSGLLMVNRLGAFHTY